MKKKSKNGSSLNSELTYLKELIQDFPCEKKVSVKKAEKLLVSRYMQLEKNIPFLLDFLNTEESMNQFTSFHYGFVDESDSFPKFFYSFIYAVHVFLFHDILSNAGQFRSASDPHGGRIGFGGSDYRTIAKFKYSGSPCSSIETELKKSCSLLIKNPVDPINAALEFYRCFVKTHPFYDGNGRIGRLILSIYAQHFNYLIKWSEIESAGNKTEFIKRLNECHKRESQHIYKTHFNYLSKFFKKFTIFIPDLEEN